VRPSSQRPRGRSVLASRGFALLWVSSTVSALGTAVTSVALPLVAVITLHVNTFQVGLLTAAGTVAWILFGLVSGVWADRLPSRPLLVTCDIVRAVVLLSVPIAAAAHLLTLSQLIAVAFIVGVGTVFFDVTVQSYIPQVVHGEELLAANSRLQGGAETARVGGPALGGVLVQLFGAPATLLTNVASFVVSAVCLLGTGRAADTEEPAPPQGGQLAQIKEGLVFVWSSPVLRPLALTAASFNFCESGIMAIQVVFLVRGLHVRPSLVGALVAGDGLGSVIGALTAGRVAGWLGSGGAVTVSVIAGPLLSFLIPLTVQGPGLLLFAVGTAGLAVFTVIFSIMARVYRQTVVPRGLLGRVTAVNRFISWGVLPIGALAAGALGSAIGNRGALWVISVVLMIATPLPVYFSPVWRSRDISPVPAASPGGGPQERPDRPEEA
jgi:MFS family permease